MISTYDLRLVTLSIAIAILAAYTTLDLALQAMTVKGKARIGWLIGGAITMGIGTWAMHFIGILAYKLPIVKSLNHLIVAISVLPTILASAVALWIVSREIAGIWELLLGSLLMAIGIATMHYTGMAAMRVDAIARYNLSGVAISVAIAILASFVALWLVFKMQNPNLKTNRWHKIGGGIVMGIAVSAMHYTGMAAVCFSSLESGIELFSSSDITWLSVVVGIVTYTILGVGLLVSSKAKVIEKTASLMIVNQKLAAEIVERKQAEVALQKLNQELESKVEARTAQLSQAIVQLETEISDRQQVQKEQARLVAILEATTDLVGITDATGSTLYLNQAGKQLFGLNEAETEGFNFLSYLAPSAIKKFQTEILPTVMEKGIWSGENVFLARDGREIPASQVIIAHKGEDGNIEFLSSLARDISERKQAEAALENSEQKYRHLVETSQDIIWSTDASGRLTFVNQAVRHIHGFEPEEMIGRPFTDFEAPEQIEQDLEAFQQLLTGTFFFQYETVNIAKDGRRLNLLFNAIAHRDDQGNILGTTGTATNITERKLAEAALQKTTRHLQQAQRIAHIGNWEYEAATETITWSDEVFNIFGHPLERGQPNLEEAVAYYHPEDKEVLQQVLDRALITGESFDIELRIIRADGELRFVNIKAEVVCNELGEIFSLFGTVMDITQRQLVEAKLREQEQFLRSIYDGVEYCIFVVDAIEDGDFLYTGWNASTERNTGFSSTQVIGKTPQALFGEVEGRLMVQNYIKCLEAGTSITYEECRQFQGEDGWFLTTLNPVKDTRGRFYRVVGTAIDISPRKKAELQLRQSEACLKQQAQELQNALEQLQRTQAQMIQAEKMSSLGQLVAGVAHEINNPVNFIFGNLSYADEYTQDLLHLIRLYQQHYPHPHAEIQHQLKSLDIDFVSRDLPKLINSMKVGAERIQKIVISLRLFSRMDESEMKEVNIHDGIDSSLTILQHRLKPKSDRPEIKIIKEYADLPPVECYAGQLNQVFMNLLCNSIDALEENLSKDRQFTPAITIRTQVNANRQLAIAIADNGCGIPPHVRSKLFDPFFTTKPVGKGTGMGLSISYQIITQKHGGSLEFISAPGQGTEFTIAIPLRQQLRVES